MGEGAEWQPVTISRAIAMDAVSAGRVELRFLLSGLQPSEWETFVRNSLLSAGDETTPRPTLRGDAIIVSSREGAAHVKAWKKNIQRVVDDANAYYQDDVIPRQVAAGESRAAEDEARRQRIEEAKKALDVSDDG